MHTFIGALAAQKPSCPQNAQPLILLLRYHPHFFFEERCWGRLVTRGSQGCHDPACRAWRLAFKMAREDLRLFFDSPLRGPTLAGDAASPWM